MDIDNTLVLWGKGPQPVNPFEESYEINLPVVQFIREWNETHTFGLVVIWSGGGVDYASTFGRRIIPEEIEWVAMAKQPITFTPLDLFIDDEPWLVWRSQTLTPNLERYDGRAKV